MVYITLSQAILTCPSSLHPTFSAMHHISSATHDSVVSLLNQGVSSRDISFRLGVSLGTISNIRKAHCPDAPHPARGCPSKLTPTAEYHLIRLTTSGGSATAAAAARELSTIMGGPIHRTTASRAMRKAGLITVTKKKKPLLRPPHIQARLDFAERHLHWTVDDWKRVIFSDETKINRLGSDGQVILIAKKHMCMTYAGHEVT
jgi:transposase